MVKVFTNIPFFRILIPFVTGVLFGILFQVKQLPIFIPFLFVLLAIALWVVKKQNAYTKTSFLVCLDIFLFIFAFNLVANTNLISQKNYYGNYLKIDSASYIIASINDLPVEKEKFTKCQLKIHEIKVGSDYKKVDGTIIGYFKRLDSNLCLKVGKTLIIRTKFLEVEPPKNPYEFDYRNYLYNKQIYHTAFIAQNDYEILNLPNQLNPIWYNGLLIKAHVIQKLKEGKLSPNAYAICAALLTGYDDDIDRQVLESFSHSGTLHVLSVSGLHTGLIYVVLSFLFDQFDRKRKYKLLKFLFITVLLWAFALMTGFSAPVLRAVIMFNLLGFGKIFFRSDSRNQINILLVSAFVLLYYNPFYITDVGFLLSYFAVFGLLFFQPKIALIWQPTNYFVAQFWQGTTVSFAATLSTLPLTLFYFKQFPLWFFVCNIIVVPVSFVILLLALLIVIKVGFAAILVNWLTDWLIAFITFFNSAKFGFIDNIDFRFIDAVFLSLIIIIFSIAMQSKSFRFMVSGFLVLICWQITSISLSNRSKTESMLTVYQINKHSALSVKNKKETVLNHLDSSNFNYHVKPHIISFNNTNLKINNFNYVEKNNKHLLILTKPNFWPNIQFSEVEYLVLANNFALVDSDFVAFSKLKTIIVDGSNNNYSANKTEKLCRKFGVELIRTKQSGAFILKL